MMRAETFELIPYGISTDEKKRVEILAEALSSLLNDRKNEFIFLLLKEKNEVRFLFTIREGSHLKQILKGVYPEAIVRDVDGFQLPKFDYGYTLFAYPSDNYPLPDVTELKSNIISRILDVMRGSEKGAFVVILAKPIGHYKADNIALAERRDRVYHGRRDSFYNPLAQGIVEKGRRGVFGVKVVVASEDENLAKNIASCFSISGEFASLKVRKINKRKVTRLSVPKIKMTAYELAPLIHIPSGPHPLVRASYIPPLELPIGTVREELIDPFSSTPWEAYPLAALPTGDRELMVYQSKEGHKKHTLVLGTTGSGKTSLLSKIVSEMVEHFGGLYFVIFPKRGDAAKMVAQFMAKFGERWCMDHVVAIDFRNTFFKGNIMRIPPEAKRNEEMFERAVSYVKTSIKSFFTVERGAMQGVHAPNVSMLIDAITDYLFRYKFDRERWNPNQITLLDFISILDQLSQKIIPVDLMGRVSSRKVPYKDQNIYTIFKTIVLERKETIVSVMNRLHRFLDSPEVRAMSISKEEGFDLFNMASISKPFVFIFDLGQIPDFEVKRAITIALVLLMRDLLLGRDYSIARRLNVPPPDITMVIDEFSEVADIDVFPWLLAEARGLGGALVLSQQFLEQVGSSRILDELQDNVNTYIILRTGSPSNLKCLKYPEEDYNKITHLLPQYHALYVIRWAREQIPPLLGKVLPPEAIELFKNQTELEKLYEDFLLKCREKWGLYPPKTEEVTVVRLSDYVLMALGSEEEMNFDGIKSRLSSLGWIGKDADLTNTLERLYKEGLITLKSKGKEKVWKISDKGRSVMASLTVSGAIRKAGGIEHRLLLDRALKLLTSKGYILKESPEQVIGEAQPDLVMVKDGEEVAVEVEISLAHPKQIVRNALKNMEVGRKVIFVVKDEKGKKKLIDILKVYGLDEKVDIMCLELGDYNKT
ncbi:MAG: hypothetical protein QXH51_05585 [Candidatus Bathyarchaeia archaeon]